MAKSTKKFWIQDTDQRIASRTQKVFICKACEKVKSLSPTFGLFSSMTRDPDTGETTVVCHHCAGGDSTVSERRLRVDPKVDARLRAMSS